MTKRYQRNNQKPEIEWKTTVGHFDLWQVGGFAGTLVSSTNKIDRHDITEILLRVALKHHKSQCYVIKFELLVVFSTNKTDRHDITEILLKVALNTITLTLNNSYTVYN
jgi:hypothetical protein